MLLLQSEHAVLTELFGWRSRCDCQPSTGSVRRMFAGFKRGFYHA